MNKMLKKLQEAKFDEHRGYLSNALDQIGLNYQSVYYLQRGSHVFVIYNSGDESKEYKLSEILSSAVYDRLSDYLPPSDVEMIKAGQKRFTRYTDAREPLIRNTSKVVVIDQNGKVRDEIEERKLKEQYHVSLVSDNGKYHLEDPKGRTSSTQDKPGMTQLLRAIGARKSGVSVQDLSTFVDKAGKTQIDVDPRRLFELIPQFRPDKKEKK